MNRVQLIALSVALTFNGSISALAQERSADAENPWYQVDLVVFRHLNNTSGEAWPDVQSDRTPEHAIKLQAPDPVDGRHSSPLDISAAGHPASGHQNLKQDAYITLPASEMLLNSQVEALEKNRNYQVMTQTAWRMPVTSKSAKYPVAVQATISGQDNLLLDGTIRVSKERFLDVDIDLWLSKLSPEPLFVPSADNSDNNDINTSEDLTGGLKNANTLQPDHGALPLHITDSFPVTQRRRIRNTDEIQYIDSPEIGVLLKLTPYEQPDAN